MKVLDDATTSENDVKIWRVVRHDSKLQYNNAATSVRTLNFRQMQSSRILWTDHACLVHNDGNLTFLRRSTKSDRVNYWSDNSTCGQSSAILDIVTPDTPITSSRSRFISWIQSWIFQPLLISTTPYKYIDDFVLVCKDAELRIMACDSATTKTLTWTVDRDVMKLPLLPQVPKCQ